MAKDATKRAEKPVWQWDGLGVPGPIEAQIIPLDSIWQSATHQRPLDQAKVKLIMDTVKVDGLLHPIIVVLNRKKGRSHELLDGGHRLEAFRRLGRKVIFAMVLRENAGKHEVERLRLVGNLARAEFSTEQRDDAIRRYMAAAAGVKRMPLGGLGLKAPRDHKRFKNQQPHDKGISRAARELGVSRQIVQRAIKYDDKGISYAARKYGVSRRIVERAVQSGYLILNKPTNETHLKWASLHLTIEAGEYARQHGLAQHGELLREVSWLPEDKQVPKLKRFVASKEYDPYLARKQKEWRRRLTVVWLEGTPEWQREAVERLQEFLRRRHPSDS